MYRHLVTYGAFWADCVCGWTFHRPYLPFSTTLMRFAGAWHYRRTR